MASHRHQEKFLAIFGQLFDIFLITLMASVSNDQSNCGNLPPASSFGRFETSEICTRVIGEFDNLTSPPISNRSQHKVVKKLSKFNQKLSQVATVWCKLM